MSRFFAKEEDITNDTIILSGDNANHIINVLRLKVDDFITICFNSYDYYCQIVFVEKNQVVTKIFSTSKNQNEPNLKITLFQSLPKLDKMELIIQKSVELGVYEIVPIITEFTIAKQSAKNDNKISRFRKISEAAAKQSGRGITPKVHDIISFKDSIQFAKNLTNNIVAYEKEKKLSLKSYLKNFDGATLGIYIGPEGGFSEKEIITLADNGVVPITLGNRILRTETAGFTVLANIFYELGD